MWDRPRLLLGIANALYALVVVMLLYAALYLTLHLPIFPLRAVRVEGELRHVTRDQVQLVVSRHLRGNFFTLNLEQTQSAFRKLPWVRNASLRRRWPDTLVITVEEHRELARWGNVALVNSYGELFHAASDSELPVFYGPGASVREMAEHYGKFSALLQPAGMKIAQLALSPRRSWQLSTADGVTVELGREQVEARLGQFCTIYARTLKPLAVQVRYADLRYPNGFAVRRLENTTSPKKAAQSGAA